MPAVQPLPSSIHRIYPATSDDLLELSSFLSQNSLIHRHLDWLSSLDWLGRQPFLFEKINDRIQGAMCATPEVKGSTWVRMFGANPIRSMEDTWERLLSETIAILKSLEINQLAALGLSPWFINLLGHSGFHHHQSIVELEWRQITPRKENPISGIVIRAMHDDDLLMVLKIDRLAFNPLWQYSLESLQKAYNQPGFHTVAMMHDQIVGYQISTIYHSHLARLAVHPENQRQHIAKALLMDLLKKFSYIGMNHVTVNTQSDNEPSLALYKSLGFKKKQEHIPVYLLDL